MWLFSDLYKTYRSLILFTFSHSNPQFGYDVIGRQRTDELLPSIITRQPFSVNPLKHLGLLIRMVINWRQSFSIIKDSYEANLNTKQVYGQLFYFQTLLGKEFDVVHINALQTAHHFKSKHWFKTAALIVSSRGQDFDFFPGKFRRSLLMADHLHVLGSYLGSKAVEEGYSGSISIIPPAHNTSEDSIHLKKLKKPIHIATAARLSWTKGYLYNLRVIKKLVNRGHQVTYSIYGDGPSYEELAFHIADLNLKRHVYLKGWVKEANLLRELHGIHIFLHLAIEEGFNNSILLAQSHGVPCVVSDAGGLPENVANGKTGYVVNRYNVDQAVFAIESLITDETLYCEMSKAALRHAKQFTLKEQLRKYTEMYTDVHGASAKVKV